MSNDSITVRLAPMDIEAMDRLIEAGHYTSRSDLVRTSIRKTIGSGREIPPIFDKMARMADEKGITTEDIVKAVRKYRPLVYKEVYGDDEDEDD